MMDKKKFFTFLESFLMNKKMSIPEKEHWTLLSLHDELLLHIISKAHSQDHFPLIVSCKKLFRIYRLSSSSFPRYAATTTFSRIRWAVETIGETPTIKWCNSAARRGDELMLFYIAGRFNISLNESTFVAAVESGNIALLTMLRQRTTAWDTQSLACAAKTGNLAVVKWLCKENAPVARYIEEEGDPFDAHLDNPMLWAMANGHRDIVDYLHTEMRFSLSLSTYEDLHCEVHECIKNCTALTLAVEFWDLSMVQRVYISLLDDNFWCAEDHLEGGLIECQYIAARTYKEDTLTWLIETSLARYGSINLNSYMEWVVAWATVPYLQWLLTMADDKWVENLIDLNVYEYLNWQNPDKRTYDVVRWLHSHGVSIPGNLSPDDLIGGM